jgi:broad specificity phosphatase PhoE
LQGQSAGFPLSENGKLQAQLAGLSLKETQFDQIYSSDLERAYETANIILEINNRHYKKGDNGFFAEIKSSKLLRERSFGVHDLQKVDEFILAAEQAGYKDDQEYKPVGGENTHDHIKRVEDFTKLILSTVNQPNYAANSKEQKMERILIVSHGGTIMRFIKYLTQTYVLTNPSSSCTDFERYGTISAKMENTAIFNFELLVDIHSGDLISYDCKRCNDANHLSEMN